MFNELSTDDKCINYKRKFSIKRDKLLPGDIQLGMFINKQGFGTHKGTQFDYYIYLCFFKWTISIGWFLDAD